MWLAVVRDVAIVLLALETLVIGGLLAITLLQIRSLARMLREEILPMLQSANDTVATVKGTTRFVSDKVVDPIIKVSSATTGTLQALRSLFSVRQRRGRPGRAAAAQDAAGPGFTDTGSQQRGEDNT